MSEEKKVTKEEKGEKTLMDLLKESLKQAGKTK